MKILVVGSLRKPDRAGVKPSAKFVQNNQSNFQAACRALGAAMVRRGHEIVVGVPDWPMLRKRETVATFVVEGANSVTPENGKTHVVNFYGPIEHEPRDRTPRVTDSLRELRALPNITIDQIPLGSGGSKARTIPNVNQAKVVLLVSGQEGTESIGYAAHSMEKPVIALTAFEGAASRISDQVLKKEYTAKGYLTMDQLSDLDVSWGPSKEENEKKADRVVEIAEALVDAVSKSGKRTSAILGLTAIGLVLLFPAWLAIFLSANGCSSAQLCGSYADIAFFALLYISALLGAGLRTLASFRKNWEQPLTALRVGTDLAISLALAFGLALIYLIGGISFTGKVVALKTGADGDSFATVAISMSLLGLGAGYVLPIDFLEDYLKNLFVKEKKEDRSPEKKAA